MFSLVAIGDPIIDTHVQIAGEAGCRVHEDELCFPYGAKIPIVNSFQDLGGNAPNVAVAAKKLGLASAVVATIGDDAPGHMAVEQLKKRGVNTEHVTMDAQAKTRYSIVLNYQAERTILSYSEKKKYSWPKPFPEAEWIYYTGLSEGFEAIQEKLLKHLNKNPETRLAVNPGSYMLKYAARELAAIIEKTDLLILNMEEALTIVRSTMALEKSPVTVMRRLIAMGAEEVVLTDAGRGSWAATYSEAWHMPAYPVKPVAMTGAGDSFSAAYITARHLRHDIPHALLWGAANSASVIQHDGPHAGLLDQKGIAQIIKRYGTKPTQL